MDRKTVRKVSEKIRLYSCSSLKLTLYPQRSLVKQQYPLQTNVCNSNTSTLHTSQEAKLNIIEINVATELLIFVCSIIFSYSTIFICFIKI